MLKRHTRQFALAISTLGIITSMPAFANLDDSPLVEAVSPVDQSEKVVQLAICLDTSGSMDGLINAARQKLWSIVNELALATPSPRLEVALLTYGNNGHVAENGWVKVETPFTQDLDKVSQMLFALTTNGGNEYVGRVVHSATEELQWHPSDDALKLIIVAGNESADQDPQIPFRDACRAAIAKGVMINSIYCVYSGDGSNVRSTWEEVARLADGQFGTIDQNDAAVVVATPVDSRMIELSSALNETYIPFGSQGHAGWQNQLAQDINAVGLNNAAAAERAQTKGQALYYCSWDLVDATRAGDIKFEEIAEDQLPDALKGKSPEEIKKYVDQMAARRATIQGQIDELAKERQQYVLAEQQRRSAREVDDFDILIRTAIRDQARASGFEFEEITSSNSDASQTIAALPYFTKIGAIWVSANYAATFEQLQFEEISGAEFTTRMHEGDEAYEQLLQQLGQPVRDALTAISNGTVFLKTDENVYQIILKAEQPTEAVGNAPQQTAQSLNAPFPVVPQQFQPRQQRQKQQEESQTGGRGGGN